MLGKGLENFTLLLLYTLVRALVHFIVSEDIVNMKAWHSQVKSGGAPYYWVKLSLFSQLSFV